MQEEYQSLIDNLIRTGAMEIGDPDLFRYGSGPSNGLDKNPSSFDIQCIEVRVVCPNFGHPARNCIQKLNHFQN